MIDTGRVLAVTTSPLGNELAEDVAAGSYTITVTDAVDFSEDGGWLRYAEAEVIQYVGVDDETGTIALATPTTVAGFEGDIVEVWNPDANDVAYETIAYVALDGEDFNSDAMEAVVPHSLIAFMSDGIREGETEYVSLEWVGDILYVRDILYRVPVIDSAYVPVPDVEAGNTIYRGDTPPWANGDTTHAEDDGDLWYDTSDNFHPYIWDGTNALWVDAADPDIDLIPDIVSDIANNNADIEYLSSELENTQETATNARDIASTADGRVSISDYDPAPGDVQYFARDAEGNLILDEEGNPVLLTRNPGSVWFTRTRSRINYCTNPSFEIDTAGWTVVGGTGARFDPADPTTPIGGTYALRIVNGTGSTQAEWTPGGNGLPVSAGQSFSASVFALLETGLGTGVTAIVSFYDATGAYLSEVAGAPVDLVTDDWHEVEVNATAPDGAAFMLTHFRNANANDVWLIDGALVEHAEYTGRYFDGDSYDSEWEGTPHASTSHMEGGKIISVYELYDSGWLRLDFTGTTQYDSDAGDLSKGILPAERIGNNSIGVEKLATNMVVASEALTAGNFVHVWSNNGLFMVRKASAQDNYEAHGFVLDSVSTGESVNVYTEGYNPLCVDLTPGPQFLSTTAGEPTGHAPAQPGQTIQRIGFASDATTLHFNPVVPIRLT